MDFIRFEITPCMLNCNHFKPRKNFWSFSIVNWLVATSSIKRVASNQHTKKTMNFLLLVWRCDMHARTNRFPCSTVFWIYDFWQGFFFILWRPWSRHGGCERYRKKKSSTTFLLYFSCFSLFLVVALVA